MTTAPIPDYAQPPAPDFNPWLVRLPMLLLLAVMLLVITLFGLLAGFQTHYRERIMPGVSAFGVDLGGMTRQQAQTALANRFVYDQQAVFTFRDGDQYWQVTAGELGVRFDVAQTVESAFSLTRGSGVFSSLANQGMTWLNGAAVAPTVVYDESIAAQKLAEIAAEINQPAREGVFQITGADVNAAPGQIGRTVDIPATLTELSRVIATLTTGAEIPLVIRETLPETFDVGMSDARARAALSAPLTLITDDGKGGTLGPWTISQEQIAALLLVNAVQHGDGTQTYEVSVDFAPFRAYLETLAPALVTQPQDARYRFNETTRELELLKAAVGGRTMNIERTLADLEASVFSTDLSARTVQIAYDYVQPRYHNSVTAAELGITEMVVEATTYYAGSPDNRRNNIAVGAALYDGILIPPGEEFSFNAWLGDLSAEAGFTEGNVIFGGRTIQGIGGGICQVSTTAFRAAFKGGYTIIERNAHGYRVGYYEQQGSPPGMDAAIWTPERDFRFQNDTPYHLLIETEVFPQTSTLQFRFYSTRTGRQVEIQPAIIKNVVAAKPMVFEANDELNPGEILQVDYAAEGADVTIRRIIRDAAGNVIKEDSIYTHYLPWAAIFQVAPGDARLAGT
jgi:vancomycin resistance protein YoaR